LSRCQLHACNVFARLSCNTHAIGEAAIEKKNKAMKAVMEELDKVIAAGKVDKAE
jgi:hypothetical protein